MAGFVQKSGRLSEKSNFTEICNRLSEYFKEKGSFGDISLGINGKLEAKDAEASATWSPVATTLNLLPSMENNSAHPNSRQKATVPSANIKSIDFFPQVVAFPPSNSIEDSANKANLRKSFATDPAGNAPMTMFYAGKVMVFNDLTADKAKQIIALARKASSTNFTAFPSASAIDNISSTDATGRGSNKVPKQLPLPPQQTSGLDVPIARRKSLHRFFAKRKERAAAKAPYQANNSSLPSFNGEEESSKPWFALQGESSKQLDLTL